MARKYGARLPWAASWQSGKTAASIAFVNQARRFKIEHSRSDKITELDEVIEKIKAGEIELTQFVTVDDWLAGAALV